MTESYWRSVHSLARRKRAALHMPGHGNRAIDSPAGGAMSDELLALDQSEIGGLD